MSFHFSLEPLLKMRDLEVKKLQQELSDLQGKQRWFKARAKSIGEESLKLENERLKIRQKGSVQREKEIESFLNSLKEALPAICAKQETLKKEISSVKQQLELVLQQRKTVERLKEIHYKRWLAKQKKAFL